VELKQGNAFLFQTSLILINMLKENIKQFWGGTKVIQQFKASFIICVGEQMLNVHHSLYGEMD